MCAGDRGKDCHVSHGLRSRRKIVSGRSSSLQTPLGRRWHRQRGKLSDPNPLNKDERNALVEYHNKVQPCRQIILAHDNQFAAWETPYWQDLRANNARPPSVPSVAGRQPRTVPTASTMVSASTASTSELRNAVEMAGAAIVQFTIQSTFKVP
jgi:hypothetical protein